MTSSPAVDPAILGRFKALLGDDGVLAVVGVVSVFLEDAPQRLATMRAALAEGDSKTLYKAAHSLKGTGGTVGAPVLAELCQALEQSAAASALHSAPDQIAHIEAEYERVVAALQDMLRKWRHTYD